MKGDFSRDTFLRLNHYARVLHQQGRVQLDADVNEQTSILLHLLRTLGADLIGAHGGPKDGLGFEVIHKALGIVNPSNLNLKTALEKALMTSLVIVPGHYYIDGLLIENEEFFLVNKDNHSVPIEVAGQVIGSVQSQPSYRIKSDEEGNHLENIINAREFENWIVYLDAWEHHITHLENDHIREVALGGPDTATRAQVVWQVRVEAAGNFVPDESAGEPKTFSSQRLLDWVKFHQNTMPRMRARINPGATSDPDPCSISTEARYRGLENQLYRVEVHQGTNTSEKPVTFKWSRENASLLTGWLETKGNKITLTNPRGFAAGNWIELLDDWHELERAPGTLVKIAHVEGNDLILDLTVKTGSVDINDFPRHPKVRRWDHVAPAKPNPVLVLDDDGAIKIAEVTKDTDPWIPLEDGLEIQFEKPEPPTTYQYRTGDYWLIPARVLLPPPGQIEYPNNQDYNPTTFLEPHGVQHHYAPLAYWDSTKLSSLRRTFGTL